MSEMIERVAAAIKNRARQHQISMLTDSDADDLARAAIEAMREPTEAIVGLGDKMAGNELSYDANRDTTGKVWREMIDASLKAP